MRTDDLSVKPLDPIKRALPRLCCFTIAVGDKYKHISDITIPRMQAYCERHNIDFIVVDDEYRTNERPCYMKQFINSLWWRYDRVLYIDSDILIVPNAPNIFDIVPEGTCGMYKVVNQTQSEQLKRDYLKAYNDAMRHIKLPEIPCDKLDYEQIYNAGMFVCDATCNPHTPPIGGVMNLPTSPHYDQMYVNLMIDIHDIPMCDLDDAWNFSMNALECTAIQAESAGKYFLHYLDSRVKLQIKDDAKALDAPHVKRLCIVNTCRSAWILESMQEHISRHAPDGVDVLIRTDPIDEDGVVNYYNNYRAYKVKSKRAKDVVFCTHPEELPLYYDSARASDAVIVMCQQYYDDMIAHGVDANKVHLIYPGVDDHRDGRLTIFNPSRMYVNNGYMQRKGADDWNKLKQIDWLNCVCTNGNMGKQSVRDMYQQCDAVVSTARMEGGAMSLLEGAAHGCRYIYSRSGVGLADDYAHVSKYVTIQQLIDMLHVQYDSKMRIVNQVEHLTWERYAQKHWDVFNRVGI